MNPHTIISRKHWLTLMTVVAAATLLITTGILFAANQTPRPDAIALQGLPAPEQGRIFAQPDDVQEDFELPPVEKEPLTYPNMDSHLNRLVEETESTRRETTSDTDGADQSVEPVLVTFYVSPEHINTLREYLEANGVFVRNVGDDYVEAHVPPLLLAPASEQPGVLRVDTVIPPRSTQSRGRVISQGVDLHGADAWHNADYRGRNVKVGVIDRGFEGFSQLQGNDLPNNVAARCYFDGPQTPSSRLADCEVEGNHGTAVILFAANQTPRPDAIALQGLPAPEQGRIFAQPDDVQEDFELPPVEKEPLTYPNMDSHLNRLVEKTENTRRKTTSDTDQTTQSIEPVLVTFYVSPDHINALREYLETNGVFVRNVGDDYIEAHVPPLLLAPASEQPGVLRVDTVIPPRSTQSRDRVISQGVGLHGADAWHNAGYRGRNVKVGVIDRGFERFRQLQGGELPNNVTARCYFDGPQTPSSRLADCEVKSNHGTAVAETVADVAPDIELYISNPHSLGDLRNAVDWMVGQGVQIINVSLGYPYDGPGDGTSPDSDSPLRTIDAAVSNGITWINSGGNDAQNAWYGTFRDPTNEGIHHWSDRDLGNAFALHEGETFAIFMRWDDNWGQADCDLDLLLFKSQRDADGRYPLVGRDITPQDGSPGSIPLASLILREEISASQAGVYFLAIIKAETCTDDPAWIQLTAWIDGVLQYHSPGHHMGNPEESRNPGMMAVGATHYWNTSTIAAYSSHGPTMDGRTKPDITGIACGRTVVSPPVADDGGQCWFRGTSQAAPHVAGLAALIRQRFPDYGPRETVSYLQQHASDRGTAGADNTWGHGLATLPVPEVTPTGTVQSSTLTRPMDVKAVSNVPGELAITWEGGDNADSYLLIAVHMETFAYETETVAGGVAKTGTVTGLTGGANYLGIVVALQASADGLVTLHETAGPVPVQSGASSPTTDRVALVALYNATSGANWADNTDWLSNAPMGEWYGVTTDDSGRVIELNLDSNQLTGTIPSSLGNLSELTSLSLHRNQLTGSLPSSLGGLSQLEVLSLGGNQFTGQIPSSLGGLSNLTGMYLWGSELTGPVPSWLGNLSNLEVLSLSENQLTGTIPSSLGNLSELTSLSLYSNQLTGSLPSSLGGLSKLEVLSLGGNQFTGQIPSSLGGLSNLTGMYLWGSELTGPVPSWLGNLSNLEALSLSENQLTGTIPSSLGNLSELTSLSLYSNQLTGSLPSSLGGLSNLEVLSLGGNQFTGQIPSSLGGLSNLTGMYLWGSKLTGPVPSWLGNLSNLEALNLSENQLTGTIPSSLGNLSELTRLGLYRNQLTGSLPSSLGGLSNLEVLSLGGNQFTGQIPSSLGGLPNLTGMYLWGNELAGPVPSSLGNLSELTILSLHRNQLTGSLPSSLGGLSKLEVLSLGGNQFTGQIPSSLGGLSNLTELYLWGSELTGPVPLWLGNLSNLEALNLSENQLTGAIPSELANLTDLGKLNLSSNQLTGPVPTWLGNLFNLTSLSLSRNQFTGTIPTEFSGSTRLTLLALNHNQLTGSVPSWLGNLTDLTTLSLRNNQLSGSIPNELGNLTRLTLLHLENNQLSGAIPSSLVNLTNLEDLLLGGNSFIGCIPPALQDVATNDLADLGLPFCLNPTTRSFNSSKGNRTPDQVTGIDSSIIETDAAKCDYATQHDADKDKYELTMTENEQATVTERLWLCLMETDSDSTMSP